MSAAAGLRGDVAADRAIDRATLVSWLGDGGEIAVFDLRPPERYGAGGTLQGFQAAPERLDADIEQLVPRRSARIVVVDDAGRQATTARRLHARGFGDVSWLNGSVADWPPDGPAFAPDFWAIRRFAEDVRRDGGTPSIAPADLDRLRRSRDDVVVLDVRTPAEFQLGHVPGAVNVPGADLLYRFADLVPAPDAPVAISCAGLARAIIGAQTLVEAGVPNPVWVLEMGTKGWTDAGLALARGGGWRFGPVSAQAAALGRQRAARLPGAREVPVVGAATLADWLTQSERTTYRLDVRPPEEVAAAAGSLPAVVAPGGQLMLGTHRYVAVRGARLVVTDDTGPRAAVTAIWLARRGFEVWRYGPEQRRYF